MQDWDVTQVGAPPFATWDHAHVLIADADPASRQWLRETIAGYFAMEEVDSGAVALEIIATGAPRLLVVGTRLVDMTGADLLARAAQWLGERHTPISAFLVADRHGEMAAVDEAQIKIFYRLVPTMPASRVRELFEQASNTLPPSPRPADEIPVHIAEHAQRIGTQEDAAAAAQHAIAAVTALVGAVRVRCLYCNEDDGTLWAEGEEDAADAKASAGAAGFAVRTGANLAIPNVGADPLYRAEIDDPRGVGNERLAVQPVAGLDGHVHAVLIAVRTAKQPPFSAPEMATLSALASAWSPYLQQLAMRAEAEDILGDQLGEGQSDMFRQEAIMHLMRRGARGDVVRVHPGWIRAAYWLVLASVAGLIAFAALAHVHEYAEGPAIIRFTGRNDVVALEAGTVTALEVQRGATVKEGQTLARLHDAEQLGRLRGLETEFERKLIAYLQTPADVSVRQALAQIVSQRESALAGVEAKIIRSPCNGVVKEVMVRNGQRVDAGAVIASIAQAGTREGLSVLAFLPGGQRPRLRLHQSVNIRLPGYRNARIGTEVMAVSSQVVAATDARKRYLGERAPESFPLTGTVVVVEGQLSSFEFEAEGERFQLHEGMVGTAEVQLTSRSVLDTILPEIDR